MNRIRRFDRGDLDFALRQTAREGWAASREQFEVYLEHDPDGCFVAEEREHPVGMVTTTCFGASGWIGNLIVEPRCRSRGIGRTLMEHGLARLRDRGTTTVRLDGDPPGMSLYRSLGFVDEVESCRFVLPVGRPRPEPDGTAEQPATAADLDEVAVLDGVVFGAGRRRFLEIKLERAELTLVLRRHRRIVAYLMASPTDRGLRIGPCVASDAADARRLIARAAATAGDRAVLIGLPALNAAGLEVLADMGFERGDSCARMRLGPKTAFGDPTRVFAISSGAVG